MEQLQPSVGELIVTLFFVLCLIVSSVTLACVEGRGSFYVVIKVGHFLIFVGAVIALLYRLGVLQLYL